MAVFSAQNEVNKKLSRNVVRLPFQHFSIGWPFESEGFDKSLVARVVVQRKGQHLMAMRLGIMSQVQIFTDFEISLVLF